MNYTYKLEDEETILIHCGKGKSSAYLLIYPMQKRIFFNIDILPKTAFLCAACDCTIFVEAKINRRTTKLFVDIDWAINQWGGPKEYIDHLKLAKDIHMERLNNGIYDKKTESTLI